MADSVPPSYDAPHEEGVPTYSSASGALARWHITNRPPKGILGSRGLGISRDVADLGNDFSGDTSVTDHPEYSLSFTDASHIEVFRNIEQRDSTASSSKDAKEKPIPVASMYFASDNISKASLSFPGRTTMNLLFDASDLSNQSVAHRADPTKPRYILMYTSTNKEKPIPICWRAQQNKDVMPTTNSENSSNTTSADNTTYNEVKVEESKWRWGRKSKDHSKVDNSSKEKRKSKSASTAGLEAKRQQEREGLGHHFTLQDEAGTIFAKFTNQLFLPVYTANASDPPKHQKHNKIAEEAFKRKGAWGYLDVIDPQLTARLRFMPGAFEKWDESEIEVIVLCSLVIVLEINIRINGGGGEGNTFSQVAFQGTTTDMYSANGGIPALTAAGLGVMAKGIGWVSRLGDQ